MDIVDTQVHANRIGTAWQSADLHTTVELTIAAMDAVGVASTLIAEMWTAEILSDSEPNAVRLSNGAWRYDHPFSELAVKLHPDRFAYVYRIDPMDLEAPELLAEIWRKPGALCTRVTPGAFRKQMEIFRSGGFDTFFAAAERHEVPVFIFLSFEPLTLLAYARRFPGVNFIVDHWGFPMPPSREGRGFEYFEAEVLPLAECPNVHLKWCKGPRFVSTQAFPHNDLEPYIQRSLDAFGPDRIMWASDNTVSRGITTWAEEIYYLRCSNLLDEATKQQIFGANARRILRWPRSTNIWPARTGTNSK